MKALSLFIALIFIANPSYAISEKDHEQNCRNLMEIAGTVIDAKQKGMSLSYALRIADDSFKESGDKYTDKTTRMIIMDAYKQPNYSTKSNKVEQANEFAAKYYLGCMEMYK